jgi:homoserine O-succinyltransferase/O-acetyltransferase
MSLILDATQFSGKFRSANCLTIGLINNMPDAGFAATERQFIDVVGAATGDAIVGLRLFSIPDVPRADHMKHAITQQYRDVSELWDTSLDGLIVTGTEPRVANLKDELYWSALTKIVNWARENTVSTIWSCLAAHATVLHIDGIQRCRLPDKQCGVFDCQVVTANQMTHKLREPFRVPHSRYNDLSERALASCGYKILTRSAVAGVDAFCKQERSFFLFFQGHPEYEADTLLREYRRDIGRFLRGEQEHYPAMPQGFFNVEKIAIANKFRDRALADRRDIDSFPMSSLEAGLERTWRTGSIGFYRNWVGYLHAHKAREQRLTVPLQRTWRDRPTGDLLPAANVR